MKTFAKTLDLPRTEKIKDPEIKSVIDKICTILQDTNQLLYGNVGAALIAITGTDVYYLGDPNTDGSWKFERSGNDLLAWRRESGSWVAKGGFSP